MFSRNEEYESDEEEETAQEKRIRLAKQYLAQIEEEGKILIKYIFIYYIIHILILNLYKYRKR